MDMICCCCWWWCCFFLNPFSPKIINDLHLPTKRWNEYIFSWQVKLATAGFWGSQIKYIFKLYFSSCTPAEWNRTINYLGGEKKKNRHCSPDNCIFRTLFTASSKAHAHKHFLKRIKKGRFLSRVEFTDRPNTRAACLKQLTSWSRYRLTWTQTFKQIWD